MREILGEEPNNESSASPPGRAVYGGDAAAFGHLVHRLTQHAGALHAEEAGRHGATPTQTHLMQELWQGGEPRSMTVLQIGDALRLAPSTITRTVSPLWKRGWIARNRSTLDRRQVWLSLTPDGEAVAAEHEARTQHYFREMLARLPQRDPQTVLDLLRDVEDVWIAVVQATPSS